MDLKVGDKVRYIGHNSEFIEFGAIGVTNYVPRSGGCYANWEEGKSKPNHDWFALIENIELVEVV